eukprot:EG_transcript_10866
MCRPPWWLFAFGVLLGSFPHAVPKHLEAPSAFPASSLVSSSSFVPLGTCNRSLSVWQRLQGLLACWANASSGAGSWVNNSGRSVTYIRGQPCDSVIRYLGWEVSSKSCGPASERQIPLSYNWQPDRTCDPQPPPWSKALVCDHHRGDVLVVGDSLSYGFFVVLHLALGASCNGTVICPDHTFRILFTRNDRLLLTNRSYFDKQHSEIIDSWFPALLLSPSIGTVLLNRGAHYTRSDIVLEQVQGVLHALRQARPDVLVVFRNTAGGHHNCWRDGGVNGPPTQVPYQSWKGQADPHHWKEFPRQNRLLEALIRARFPGVLYLDVEQATSFRQDSHLSAGDCLHYCIPGPLDHWVEAFAQLLWAVGRHCPREASAAAADTSVSLKFPAPMLRLEILFPSKWTALSNSTPLPKQKRRRH